MNRRSLLLGISALAAQLLARRIARADANEIVIIVHKANPNSSINRSQLSALYRFRSTEFPDGSHASPVNLPMESSLRRDFDRAVLGMTPDEVERFWIDSKIRGGVGPPRRLPGPDAVVRYVAGDRSGIGYVSRSDANDTVRIIARIRDGKLV